MPMMCNAARAREQQYIQLSWATRHASGQVACRQLASAGQGYHTVLAGAWSLVVC